MELVMVFSKAFTGKGEREPNIRAPKIKPDNLMEYLNILTIGVSAPYLVIESDGSENRR
jgi:hypothetical protein